MPGSCIPPETNLTLFLGCLPERDHQGKALYGDPKSAITKMYSSFRHMSSSY